MKEKFKKVVSRSVFEQVMWERDVAIEQLKELGYSLGEKIKPQDGDLISRKALLEKKWDVPFDGKYIQVVDVGDIEDAPPISHPQEGHWIEHPHKYDNWEMSKSTYKCSKCGELTHYNSIYCPNCGCRMVGDDNG